MSPVRIAPHDFPHYGKAPNADFYAPDLQDSTNPSQESVLHDYASPKAKRVSVYPAFIHVSEFPSPVLAEEDANHRHTEECDEDPDSCPNNVEYPWEDFKIGNRPFPVPKIHRARDGRVTILDGNHRVSWWLRGNYTHIPAWVVDEYRPLKLKKSIGGLPKGLIDPRGNFHDVDADDDHHQWITREGWMHDKDIPKFPGPKGDEDPADAFNYWAEDVADSAYRKAVDRGWMAVGIGGEENVLANSRHLFDPTHPATKKLQEVAQGWGPRFQAYTSSVKSAPFSTKHFTKLGKFVSYVGKTEPLFLSLNKTLDKAQRIWSGKIVNWPGHQKLGKEELIKVVDPLHLRSIKNACTPEGPKAVDHTQQMEVPGPVKPYQEEYRQTVLESPKVEKPLSRGKNGGITKKVIYQSPTGTRYMVKPYYERIIKRIESWQRYPVQGWSELTNQALYHAGGIGNLHQKVFVAEHPMDLADRPPQAAMVTRGQAKRLNPEDLQQLDFYRQTDPEAFSGEEYVPRPASPREPALVVAMDSRYPHEAANIRFRNVDVDKVALAKIAIMDCLSNNMDRHGGNLLFDDEWNPLAIDHSRSFQYSSNYEHKWKGRRIINQFGRMNDAFSPYVVKSALGDFLPTRGPGFPLHRGDFDEAFEWWGLNSHKIRAEMEKQLSAIKDEKIRDHIRKNFNVRADHFDKYALGLDRFDRNTWDALPFPLYHR